MEDVIDVYTRPYDPLHPVVCFDESNKQLVGETVEPLPMEPGQPQRYDYQYERHGVCNLFMFSEPLAGWRHVEVTDRRTKQDYAQQMKYLVDVCYPAAALITVVHDQLNTHVPSSLYEAFEPAEAKRILDKLEFHYTPKHGSWLNIAEIELSVLARQCARPAVFLTRSLCNERSLLGKNDDLRETRKIDWQFTTADARIKLKRLYPSIQT